MRRVLVLCTSVIVLLTSSGLAQVAVPPTRVMADGRTWTARNLDVPDAESFCYDADENQCRRLGRLYTWQAALRACGSLGPGWRLPSDADWRSLAQRYGDVRGDDGRFGSEAYDALLAGGRSGFEAVLGGGRSPDGTYGRGDAHGFYWTASESGPSTAVFYNFGKGSRGLYRQPAGPRDSAFAVRCVKD